MKLRVGLDIGTTKIICIIGGIEDGEYTAIDFARNESRGIVEGVINNISKTVDSIKSTVSDLEKKTSKRIKEVSIGVAGRYISSINHSDYINIKRDNKKKIIQDSDLEKLKSQIKEIAINTHEKIINIYPQSFKVDGQRTDDPVGMSADRLEGTYHVVSADVSAIENIKQCIQGSSLDISRITLESISSANAVLSEEEIDAGVLIVDIGGGTTDIAIFKDNVIKHTAVIPFGGNNITESIEDKFDITKQVAEKLKIKHGSMIEVDEECIIKIKIFKQEKKIKLSELSKLIKYSITTNIIDKVQKQLDIYGYNKKGNKLIAGIVLTGGGANLKGIAQYFKLIINLETRLGINKVTKTNEGVDINCPSFSTSIGLLIQDIESSLVDSAYSDISKNIKYRKFGKFGRFVQNIFNEIKKIVEDDKS